MLRMCLNAVVLNDSDFTFFTLCYFFFIYLISELFNVFLFIHFVCFVSLWFVLFIVLLY